MNNVDPLNDEITYIVRRKVMSGGQHAIAAWKIAYADFVTAMMSFFLLLWLLNASMTLDLSLLGNSFVDESVDDVNVLSSSGNISNKGGASHEDIPGEEPAQHIVEKIFIEQEPTPIVELETKNTENQLTPKSKQPSASDKVVQEEITIRDIEDQLKEALRQIYSETPAKVVETKIYPDQAGLNIEFINDEGQRTFRWGSSKVTRPLKNTLYIVTRFFSLLERPIEITGHSANEGDTLQNWDLSYQRAENTRQAIVRMGIADQRIYSIGGKGNSDMAFPDDPLDMQNIRIKITMLNYDDHALVHQKIRSSAPPKVSRK